MFASSTHSPNSEYPLLSRITAKSRPLQLLRSRLTTKRYCASTVAVQKLSDLLMLGRRKLLSDLLQHSGRQAYQFWLPGDAVESILALFEVPLAPDASLSDDSLSTLLGNALSCSIAALNAPPLLNLHGFWSVAKLIWNLKHSD